MSSAAPVRVRSLGLQDYESVWSAMREFTDARDPEQADEFWLVEHLPVFTLGQAGRVEHVLAPGDIPLVHSDRGGQVTYHGPGQVVLYTLINMRRLGIGVRTLVESLEDAVISVLNDEGIAGVRREGAPGVYVSGAKVAALGLRVRRACSYHGVALNVDMDLEPFSRINPCGYEGLQVTSVRELGSSVTLETAGQALVRRLAMTFGVELAVADESESMEALP